MGKALLFIVTFLSANLALAISFEETDCKISVDTGNVGPSIDTVISIDDPGALVSNRFDFRASIFIDFGDVELDDVRMHVYSLLFTGDRKSTVKEKWNEMYNGSYQCLSKALARIGRKPVGKIGSAKNGAIVFVDEQWHCLLNSWDCYAKGRASLPAFSPPQLYLDPWEKLPSIEFDPPKGNFSDKFLANWCSALDKIVDDYYCFKGQSDDPIALDKDAISETIETKQDTCSISDEQKEQIAFFISDYSHSLTLYNYMERLRDPSGSKDGKFSLREAKDGLKAICASQEISYEGPIEEPSTDTGQEF